ncbi:MAG TPA: hypothetical protein VF789_00865 [Thermoanaerobaculia bacterium]
MRNRNFLPIFLLAFALAAPVAMADPGPGAAAFAERDKDKKNKNKGKKDKDKKDHRWEGRDRDDDGRGRRDAQGIPPGHLPPPGACRVWYNGVPPGQQPPPTDCDTARREAARGDGRVIYGGDRDDRYDDHYDDHYDDRYDDRWTDRRDDDWWDDSDRWDDQEWIRRFDSLDRNNDGALSRAEWTADDRIFEVLDVNDDRLLSRGEFREARRRYLENRRGERLDQLEDRFRDNDDNRDGRVSLNEWWGRDEEFDRLDRNNDGYLSWVEVADTIRGSR